MSTKLRECSARHKFMCELDPYTNYVLACAIYVIGVGVNSASDLRNDSVRKPRLHLCFTENISIQ